MYKLLLRRSAFVDIEKKWYKTTRLIGPPPISPRLDIIPSVHADYYAGHGPLTRRIFIVALFTV